MFASRLKELRKQKDMSQTEVARALGISQSTWALYESGNREPNFDALLKISEFFDVYTDYLLGKQKYKNIDEELQVVGSKGVVEGKLEAEMPEVQLELTDIFIQIIDIHHELSKAEFPAAQDFLYETYKLMQSLYLYSKCLSEIKIDHDNSLSKKKNKTEDFSSIIENTKNLTMHLKRTVTEITDNLIDEISNNLLEHLSENISIDPTHEDNLALINKLTDKLKGGLSDGNSNKKK